MLQRDPLKQNVHKHIWLVVLYTLFIAFLMFIVLSRLLSIYYATDAPLYMVIIYSILFLLLLSPLAFNWGWFWAICRISRRRRQKRLRALQGNQDLLFSAQPLRNEHALVLPTIVEVKMRMTIFFIFIAVLIVIYLSLSFLPIFIQIFSFEDPQLLVVTNGCMLLLSILFVLLVARIAARYMHQQITVTEQGITTRYRGKTMSLSWNDARFFSLHGSTRSKRLFLYELSGMKGGVMWMKLRSNSFLLKPLIPFEHYQQQMNALSELVAAKTNLPLYDLRDTRAIN